MQSGKTTAARRKMIDMMNDSCAIKYCDNKTFQILRITLSEITDINRKLGHTIILEIKLEKLINRTRDM